MTQISGRSAAVSSSGAGNTVGDIFLPGRTVPVRYEADVVVVGGGISGTAAAVAAAMAGAKTLVVEKGGFLAGSFRTTMLAGFFGVGGGEYLPEITEGLARDFIKTLVRLKAPGADTLEQIETAGAVWIDPELTAQAFFVMAREAGVQPLFHAQFTRSVVEGGTIKAIVAETAEGPIGVAGKVCVDATGLALLCLAAGVPVGKEDSSMGVQAVIGGVDADRFQEFCGQSVDFDEREYRSWFDRLTSPFSGYDWDSWWKRTPVPLKLKYREAIEKGDYRLFEEVGDKGCLAVIEGLKVLGEGNPRFIKDVARPRTLISGVDPLDYDEINRAEMLSHQHLFDTLFFLKKYVPGFENAFMLRLSDEISARGGRYVMTGVHPTREEINRGNEKPPDVVYTTRRPMGNPFHVPYRTLLPPKIDNLLMVGRSAAGRSLRFVTGVFIMGEVGGTAAALCVREGVSPRKLDVTKLQSELRSSGVRIP